MKSQNSRQERSPSNIDTPHKTEIDEVAIKDLLEQLQHSHLGKDPLTYFKVLESLRKIEDDNKKSINALEELLKSQNVNQLIRWKLAEILGKIDTGNEIAIATLVELLKSQYLDWQKPGSFGYTLESLEKIAIGNETVIAALVQLLRFQDCVDNEIPSQYQIGDKTLFNIRSLKFLTF
ncbi:MAG: HEAT repeat domain-containing protein, partial [Trichormus sp.]